MGATLSHAACLAVGYLYPSYLSYKELKNNVPNLDLLHRLTSWSLVTVFLILTHRIFDPTLLVIIPFYPIVKLGVVWWLVSEHSRGGSVLFVKHVEPFMARFDDGFAKGMASTARWLLDGRDD